MKDFKLNETEGHYLSLRIDDNEIVLAIVNQEILSDQKALPFNRSNLNTLIATLTHLSELIDNGEILN